MSFYNCSSLSHDVAFLLLFFIYYLFRGKIRGKVTQGQYKFSYFTSFLSRLPRQIRKSSHLPHVYVQNECLANQL